MEPASRPSSMPLPENLRPKQKEIIDLFSSVDRVIAKLPTGYGKTKAAAGSFSMKRHLGTCTRMLYIVPRRNQANQAAEDLPSDLAEFGIATKTIIVGSEPIRALKAHASGSVLVFIVTVQSLLSRGTWSTVVDLMQTGKWFVVVDEHQHYGDDGAWTDKVKNLSYAALLAMSATPLRYDGSDHFEKPIVVETYISAADAGYVKKLSLHAYHYQIDAVTVDGTVHQYTTESLTEEAGSDSAEAIEAFLTSRKMRFSPKYVSPLIMFPLDRLIDLRARGIRAQMLIQAMSCSHAQCIIEQIRALIPENIRIDWVGTGPNGRSQEDNDRVLGEWCPQKNKATGKRPWTLDILVNVGMAGEGTDTVDVTEVVFLTPANITISNLQTIGRGSRRMKIAHGAQPFCHVNVDTGSPMADYIGAKVMELFDEGVRVPDEDDDNPSPREAGDYEELPEKLGWMIADMRLVDIRSEIMFKEVSTKLRKEVDLARTDEEVAAAAEKAVRDYLNRTNNQTAIHAQKVDQIEAAVSKIAGLVIRRMNETGLHFEKSLAGDLKRRINGRKKGHLGSVKDADEAMLDQHWEWLRQLEKQILLDHGLNGVPQWLR